MVGRGSVEEGCVSGALVMQQRSVVAQRFGDGLWESALGELAPERRDEIAALTSLGWLRLSTLEALYAAMARRTDSSVAALHSQVARESVDRALRTIWRLMMRFTSDAALLARAPILYSHTYSRGKLQARIQEPGVAELEIQGWPDVPEFAQRGLRVGVESVLRLAGRHNVRVTSEPRADGARMLATWKA